MTTERIDVVVSERGAKTVQRNIEGIGGAAQKAEGHTKLLGRALGLLGGAMGLRELQKMIDTYTNLQNRLRLVTEGTSNLNGVTEELFRIANRTRNAYEGVVDLYVQTANATEGLGRSQAELLQFTERLNQAVTLSGASAQAANAAIIQLGQGMASGTLRGEELNSVMEQLPVVADIIAKGLGVTRGELREMGKDGKITAEIILDAFKKADYIAAQFATTVPTIGQAMTVATNSFTKWIAETDKALGVSEGLARAILALAENMDTLMAGITSVSTALILLAGPAVLGKVLAGLKAVAMVVKAHPFAMLVSGAAAVVTWLVQMDKRFDPIIEKLGRTVSVVDRFKAAWAGAKAYVQAVWEDFPAWLLDIGKSAVNGIVSTTAGGLNKIASMAGSIFGKEFAPIDVSGLMMELSGAGDKAANAYNEAFKKALIDYSKEIGKASTVPGVKTAKTSKGEEDKEAKRRLQQLMQQYQQLRDHLDPLGAVTREWAEAEKILNEALKANIVDQKTYNDLIEAAATYYTEAAYPVTQLRKEIERQTELLGHEIGQREILDTIYQKEKEMRRALTEVERESIAVALEHFQAKEKEVRLYEELQQPYTQHAERLKYLETLYEKGKISTEQYTKALNETALAMLDLDKSASAGLSRGIIRLQDEFTDLASVVEQGLMNAFRGAEDALVSFVQTGKVDFKKLIDSMIADLIRLAVRQQIMSFAVNALGGMATGGTAAPITVATPVAPRALGGPVLGGKTYSINERRQPEMLSVGGKDYLTMGSESGRVTPLQPGGRGGAVTVVVEPVIYNNASDSVQATTETQQDENGNVSMTVMINKIEQGIAGNVQSGNSPLLKSMGAALGVTPKPRGR